MKVPSFERAPTVAVSSSLEAPIVYKTLQPKALKVLQAHSSSGHFFDTQVSIPHASVTSSNRVVQEC